MKSSNIINLIGGGMAAARFLFPLAGKMSKLILLVGGGISQLTAPSLAHSDKSKLFQNFAALHRTPEYVLFHKTFGRSDPTQSQTKKKVPDLQV